MEGQFTAPQTEWKAKGLEDVRIRQLLDISELLRGRNSSERPVRIKQGAGEVEALPPLASETGAEKNDRVLSPAR